MNSIQGRLSRYTIATLLVLYALVAGAIYIGIARYLEARVDAALQTKASVMATLVHMDGEQLEFEFDDLLMPEYSRASMPEYFELRRADRSIFERSLSLARDGVTKPMLDPGLDRIAWDIELPDGRHGRALALAVFPQVERDGELDGTTGSEPLRLVLAQGLEQLDSVRGALRAGLILGGVALWLLVALALRWSLARGLEPLTALARQVETVTPESLDVEFSSVEGVRELAGIRTRLDELVERLGSALERERRFTSAAAHELRTPLAELKTMAQVAARFPEDHELRARVPGEVLVLVARMQSTVESLLAFARATKSGPTTSATRSDVSALLLRLIDERSGRANADSARIQAAIEPALLVRADPTLLESVLRNLLDNAFAHGPALAPIAVRARLEADSIVVELENPRGDLTERDLGHLFEPFWRKDVSRHGDAHSGLGLALVEAWVKSWGGTIRAELARPDLVRFSLYLPGAGPNQ